MYWPWNLATGVKSRLGRASLEVKWGWTYALKTGDRTTACYQRSAAIATKTEFESKYGYSWSCQIEGDRAQPSKEEFRRGWKQIETFFGISPLKSAWKQKVGCNEGLEDWIFANVVGWNERNPWRNSTTTQEYDKSTPFSAANSTFRWGKGESWSSDDRTWIVNRK